MNEQNMNGGTPPVNPQENIVPTPQTPVAPVQPQPVQPQSIPVAPVQPQPVQPQSIPVAPVQPQPVQPQSIPVAPVAVQPVPVSPVPDELPTEAVADIPVADPINSGTYSSNNQLNSSDVGFVATGQSLEKKKSKKGLIVIILLLIALLGVGGFFLVKLVILPMLITPKDVFTTTIDTITKEVNNTINNTIHDKSILTLEFDVDTNVEAFKQFSGYTYSGKYGVDPTNKLLEIGFGIKDQYDKEYSYYSYVKDDKTYERFSTQSSLLYTGALEQDSDIYGLFEYMKKSGDAITPENTTYLINKVSNTFVESIDENKFSELKMSVTVNGEIIKAVKSTYSLDENSVNATIKQIAAALLKDSKSVTIIANAANVTESDVKQLLQKILDTKTVSEEAYTLNLSIYTDSSKTEFVGLEIEINEEEDKAKVQYITANGNFNIFIYSKADGVESSTTIDGVKTGNVTKVTVKEKKDLLTIRIEETSNGKIIDFEILEGPAGHSSNYTGNIVYTTKQKDGRNTDTYNVTVKAGDEYVKVNAKITNDWNYDVANINTSAATAVTDEELQNIYKNFTNELTNNTPWNSFLTLIGMFEVEEYEVEVDQNESWQ